jgi:exodeoxyribonuclease-3
MNIISWNVNGLRAVHKKGALAWLIKESPDIFCFQETKCEESQAPEELISLVGYHKYFASSAMVRSISGW